MMLQDGDLLDFLGNIAKDPLGKEMVIRAKELEPSKVVGPRCVSIGEKHSLDNLPNMFVNFNTFMGCLLQILKNISILY